MPNTNSTKKIAAAAAVGVGFFAAQADAMCKRDASCNYPPTPADPAAEEAAKIGLIAAFAGMAGIVVLTCIIVCLVGAIKRCRENSSEQQSLLPAPATNTI